MDYFKTCYQVTALVRLLKTKLTKKAFHALNSKKDIFLYIDRACSTTRIRSWFASLTQSILIRYAFRLVF